MALRPLGGGNQQSVETSRNGLAQFEVERAWPALWVEGATIFKEIATLRPDTGDVLDYGVVRVRARAKLVAKVTGLATPAGAEVQLGVRYVEDSYPSDRLFGPEIELVPTRGVAATTLEVEALRDMYLVVKGPGLSRRFETSTVRAEPGQTVELVVDIAALCSLEGRIIGIPPGAALQSTVWSRNLARAASSGDGASPGGGVRSERQDVLPSEVGEDGRFSLHGLEPRALRLTLGIGIEQVPLVRAEAPSEVPFPCESREIEFVPAEPLVAVGVFERDGRGPLPLLAHLSVAGRGLHAPGVRESGWWLVKRSALGAGATLAVHSARLGWARVSDAGARVDEHGALRVWIDEFASLEGAIVATFESEPAAGLGLECRQLAGDVRLSGTEPPVGVPTGSNAANGIEFRGLPTGRYELVWRRGGVVRRAVELEHVEGARTQVRLAPPGVVELAGRVRVSCDSDDGRTALPSVVAVRLDVQRHNVIDGHFQCAAFDPLPVSATVEFDTRLEVVAECSRTPTGELELTLDCESLRAVRVPSCSGGSPCAERIPGVAPVASWHSPANFVEATSPGLLHLARSGPAAAVRIWEIGPEFKLLRGWVLPDSPDADPFDGRWVELAFAAPRGTVSVFALTAFDPTGAPLGALDSTEPTRIWIPRAASRLRLQFFDGSAREVTVDGDALWVP